MTYLCENPPMAWKRTLTGLIDRLAAPASAAIVGWLAATTWLLPELPNVYAESMLAHLLIQASASWCAFVVARRWL